MDLKTGVPNINAISQSIPSFHDLTSVLVPGIPLDFNAIIHLAGLRDLNTLAVYTSPEIRQEDYDYLTSISVGGQVYFPNLRRLNLKNRLLTLCTSLLKVVSSSILESVTFTTVHQIGFICTTEDVSELCIQLGRHPSLGSVIVAVRSMLHGSRLTPATFAPFLTLSDLTALDIDIPHAIDVDNAFLAEMAYAWRKITRLKLWVQNHYWRTDGDNLKSTIPGLLPFARLCPALEVLGLPVSGDLSSLSRAALKRRPFLTSMSASTSSLIDAPPSPRRWCASSRSACPSCARCGSDLFPEQTGISTAWMDAMREDMPDGDIGTPEEINARWDEVAWLARWFGNVRRQERNWLAVQRDARGARPGGGLRVDAVAGMAG